MSTGVTRIVPFAVISAALHAAVLMNAPERLEISVTPGGNSSAVAVRLVPSGPTTPDPAAPPGVAGSSPEAAHLRDKQPESAPATAETTSSNEIAVSESSRSSEPEATGPDRVQAASGDRITTEITPTDTDQKHANTDTTEQTEQPDESGTTPDAAEESAKAAANTKTGTSDTADPPQTREASETTEKAKTSDPTRAEDASATVRTAEATDRSPKAESSKTAADEKHAGKQSGADGADDRAQIASRARQEVQIHFRDRFHYPRIARQRGWEGRVVLTFRLQPDGRITDVEVTESSGRFILDENARQTLIDIQRVPELADRLGPEPLELAVPVTYRLQPA